jgi:hypothetical protein
LSERETRLRVRLGNAELEIAGTPEFVIKMSKEFEFVLKEASKEPGSIPPSGPRPELPPRPASNVVPGQIPKTGPDKLASLRDSGYFAEPKGSSDIVAEYRNRGWGIYKAKDVSSVLIQYAAKLGLRRVPLSGGRFGYTYP